MLPTHKPKITPKSNKITCQMTIFMSPISGFHFIIVNSVILRCNVLQRNELKIIPTFVNC